MTHDPGLFDAYSSMYSKKEDENLKEEPITATAILATKAAMAANGQSIINRIYHLDRGYEKIEKKLKKIGVNIKRLS